MLVDILTKEDLLNFRLVPSLGLEKEFPSSIQSEEFWKILRKILREELEKYNVTHPQSTFETPGLVEKPLYKITEVCALFQITKPTLYEWIKQGKLKALKVNSRVFFLAQDVKALINSSQVKNNN